MIKRAFLLKYGELALKGKNRYLFENSLVDHIRSRLKPIGAFVVMKEQGRIFVEPETDTFTDAFENQVIEALQKVFGLIGISPVWVLPDSKFETICAYGVEFLQEQYADEAYTFKVQAKRSDKRYPLNSMEIAREVGAFVLQAKPNLTVDVKRPQVKLNIEIRTRTYLYSKVFSALGGMPAGTNGRAMLMLSGGIDSPVAGYMVAKRGVAIDAVYFDAPPYTSDRAREKVITLAKILSSYTGKIRLHIVPFTDVQVMIYEKAPHNELTILMRRIMMRISEHFAKQLGASALITGESIGQVASQTIAGLVATNAVCELPIFQPLIAFDKQDIIDISEKIGTYETSILPYEDCCTIFVAKHPVTRPQLKAIERSEALLEGIDVLIDKAIEDTVVVVVKEA